MITYKSIFTIICVIVIILLSNPIQALDAAALYKERTCIACHGVEGKQPVMDVYPKLAGQNALYMLAQMKDIKNGTRKHGHTAAMQNVMHLINDEEMSILVDWLSKLSQ
jgi:cytochrome c